MRKRRHRRPARTPGRFDTALANYENRKGIADYDPSEGDADALEGALVSNSYQPPSHAVMHDLAGSEIKSEKPELVRVAQNGPLTGANIPASASSSFATDGVNRVEQRQNNAKVRKGQLSFELEDQLNYAAYKSGLRVEVNSGGQSKYGRYKIDWIGSERHDDGGSGDVRLFEVVNGRKRYLNSTNDADRQKIQDFMRYTVIAGATGIGHGYMGPETTHIGGGSVEAWREVREKPSDPPPRLPFPWVKGALDEGVAERQRLMKGGWDGVVDTLAKGRPLSLKPPQQNPPPPALGRKEREQGFFPGKRLLPGLY